MAVHNQERQARQAFHSTLESAEFMALEYFPFLDSDLAKNLATNLGTIERAIQDCEAIAGRFPGHRQNRLALAAAYQAKVDLIERILEG